MVSILRDVQSFLKVEQVETDNFVFRLHYKATVGILMTCSILLSAKQYFGDPIFCEVDGVPNQLMNTYCWINGTYTIPELGQDIVQHEVAHPGVGHYNKNKHTKIYHRYYQWVALVLALTAVSFYAPRFVWKFFFERGLMTHVCDGMKFLCLNNDSNNETTEDMKRANKLFHFYTMNGKRNNIYYWKFFLCELMNLVNVVIQWHLTNLLLDGNFNWYGHHFYNYVKLQFLDNQSVSDASKYFDPGERIFPKISMCHFNMHGSTGDIMHLQGLCILPLNILNEKIYYLLWFWYVVIFTCSMMTLSYRILIIFAVPIRSLILKSYHGLFDQRCIDKICYNGSIGDWFVLRQMSKNVDPMTFSLLIDVLANFYANKSDRKREEYLKRGRRKTEFENLAKNSFINERQEEAKY